MLLLAVQKGRFPFEKALFLITLKVVGGGGTCHQRPLPTPLQNDLPFNALRIHLHMAFHMRGGDSNREQNKKLLTKRLYNICH